MSRLFRVFLFSSIVSAFWATSAYAQFPNPVTNVQASDGTSTANVQVSWNAPSGGAPVASYKVYRSTSNQFCAGSIVGTVTHPTTTFQDTTATPSIIYYYSVRAIGLDSLESNCSNTDFGYRTLLQPPLPPINLSATNNLLDKIALAWQLPGTGEAITGIQIFRATTQTVCAGSAAFTLGTAATAFDDTSAVPGQVYFYSLKSTGPTGISACSDLPVQGYRVEPPPPLPPVNVAATDGNFTDKVRVNWQTPTGSTAITNYRLHRSTVPALCNQLLADGVSAASSERDDNNAVPGRLYYYSMDSLGPNGLSTCSNLDPGYARISPPINVSATDGTFTDQVVLSWQPPTLGGDITGYEIYKSTTPGSACEGSPLVANQSPSNLTYSDTAVTPGQLYYYSMKTLSPTGPSECSVINSGFPRIGAPNTVQATDGTFPDKVDVNWTPPTTGGQIVGYTLYRDLTPLSCQTVRVSGFGPSTTSFSDFAVTPGTVYYYSVKTVSTTGDSLCSPIDPGFPRIGAPNNVQATDGTFTDKVDVSWNPPVTGGPILSYILYRDLTPLSCQTVRATGFAASTTTFSDTAVVPGTIYHYSVKTVAATGESVCSSIDPGFARLITICSDGLDNDNDGLIDLADPGCKGDSSRNTEKDPSGFVCDNGLDDDQDGKIDYRLDSAGDPGCNGPTDSSEQDANEALKSPAYIKFNSFLGQWNFAELVNQGNSNKAVDLTIYNLFGQPMITRTFIVSPKSEVDVDVNAMLMFACDVLNSGCSAFKDLSETAGAQNGLGRPDGVVDTYGLVELRFDDSNTNERLTGRMSFYRPNADGSSFSFAFAREFRNPLKGASYAGANTIDPQGFSNLVPNWSEVINLSTTVQSYTVNLYSQSGILRDSRNITLAPLGEFDVQAGHEFRKVDGSSADGVYLSEVVPANANAPYSFSVSRYSSNQKGGGAFDPENYNFALSIDGQNGTTESLYAPIANKLEQVTGLDAKVSITNWVEVVNVSSVLANAEISFRDKNGSTVSSSNFQIPPKGQFHFNAGAILPTGSSGVVRVKVDRPAVSQSLSYVHGPSNELQSGFVLPARVPGLAEQSGSVNTFLQMQNVLTLISTANQNANTDFSITSFGGGNAQGVIGLGASGSSTLQLSNNQVLNFPTDAYGAVTVDSGSDGLVLSDIRRVRVVKGAVDFVMPTAIR